ncbi:MAG: hypothetical protein IAE92_14645 [Burkholderiaceae bacterium]|nr:hypothetical protein [Burkholderiaceae bacterium]
MPEANFNLLSAVYSKTPEGQQEIQSRALGLSPLVRRTLVLVDGQRSGADLAVFATGQDISAILNELLEKGCIAARVVAAAPPKAAPAAAPAVPSEAPAGAFSADLTGLPPVETRGPKEVEMARNFMMNTVNTIFGQNTRFTLMEAIFACKTAEDTRRVYSMWAEALNTSRIGAKRLPELREKLFQVL